MKLLPLLLLSLLGTSLFAQVDPFPIEGKWLFQKGDDPAWKQTQIDDHDWTPLDVGQGWESQIGNYDGYGWYRKKVFIPASLKAAASGYGTLLLDLGAIDDDDECYLNGQQIGATKGYNVLRHYLLQHDAIQWDAENTIAIRVSDTGGGGGLWKGRPAIRELSALDFLSASIYVTDDYRAEIRPGQPVIFSVKITNRSQKPIQVVVDGLATDAKGSVIFNEKRNTQLSPGEQEVSFTCKAATGDMLRLQARLWVADKEIWSANRVVGFTPLASYTPVLPKIPFVVTERYIPLASEQAHFGGYWGNRLDINLQKRLLQVDETTLLAGFFQRPGEQDWIGEHVGKYLETASNAWRYSHDPALKQQMDRIAQHLIATQLPDGYLGTYTDDQRWTSWDVWIHKYNLYGLLTYYELTGYEPALLACRKMGNLLCSTFGEGKKDIILSGTHVGMAATSILEPMLMLYQATGDQQYLDFCYYLIKSWDQPHGPQIIATLNSLGRVDKTANAKAYEMLSNLVGLVRLYKLTGDEALLQPVLIAWQDIVTNRLYLTGSASSFEHFQDNHELPAEQDRNMGEGCVSTTWLQLNLHLLTLTGDEKYAAEIEKTAYNQLLGSENPQNGCVSYYTPLIGQKPYGCLVNCCVSSVPRGIALMSRYILGNLDGDLTLMSYEPSEFQGQIGGKSVQVHVESDYPATGKALLSLEMKGAASGNIRLRIPSWAENFRVETSGDKQLIRSGAFLIVSGKWKNGEAVTVTFDMPVKAVTDEKNYPGRVAFLRGPQVLALDGSLNQLSDPDRAIVPFNPAGQPLNSTQVFPAGWIGNQGYRLGNETGVVLVPFADASQSGGKFTVWIRPKE